MSYLKSIGLINLFVGMNFIVRNFIVSVSYKQLLQLRKLFHSSVFSLTLNAGGIRKELLGSWLEA